MKYWLIIAMVLIGVTFLVSGNTSAAVVAPQPNTMVVSGAPVESPLFGSGISPGVVTRSSVGFPFFRPFGFPFFRPFFGFPFFNPFFDVDVDPFFFD